jgi:hypothetical protein
MHHHFCFLCVPSRHTSTPVIQRIVNICSWVMVSRLVPERSESCPSFDTCTSTTQTAKASAKKGNALCWKFAWDFSNRVSHRSVITCFSSAILRVCQPFALLLHRCEWAKVRCTRFSHVFDHLLAYLVLEHVLSVGLCNVVDECQRSNRSPLDGIWKGKSRTL